MRISHINDSRGITPVTSHKILYDYFCNYFGSNYYRFTLKTSDTHGSNGKMPHTSHIKMEVFFQKKPFLVSLPMNKSLRSSIRSLQNYFHTEDVFMEHENTAITDCGIYYDIAVLDP